MLAARNGPRYWVLDLITSITDGESMPVDGFGDVVTFGTLDMRLAATVSLAADVSGEGEPYSVNEVARSTVFTFVADLSNTYQKVE
jgi:hypothetical protein